MRHPRSYTLAIALTLVAVSALTGCGSDDDGSTSTTTTSTAAPTTSSASTTTTDTATSTTATSAPTTSEATATTVPASGAAVNVYWSWSVPTIVSGTPERLGAGGRDVADTDTIGAALEALLAGPDDVEAEIGMGTEVPTTTELESLELIDTTAVVGLSSAFETPSGTLSETLRIAQVVFTATQFDEVELVRFRIDGVDVDVLGSHGIDVGDGVDRDDFTDVRPFILVESPTPGATVGDAFTIGGEANTFEATVEWAVTDRDGLIVQEGFTTATAGNGTWGRFDVDVELAEPLDGIGAVIVFNTSAVDGTQIDVVEYPVQF